MTSISGQAAVQAIEQRSIQRAKMTGGQAVVAALEAAGVEVVFGIPGVHNLDIYDALVDSKIRSVHVRHEEGCSFMADGYSRASGRPGVAITITGPGATNALTGVGAAYADSSRLLVITAQLARPFIDRERGELHDIRDQLGVFRPLTLWNARAMTVGEIPRLLGRAMHSFYSRRPRPIQIEIPLDVLGEQGDVVVSPPPAATLATPDAKAIAAAVASLAKAQRPVILAGGGVNKAGAGAELQRVAELLQAPVLTSCMGMGAIPDDHPLSLGTGWDLDWTFGKTVAEADVLLAVGCRFHSLTTRLWTLRVPDELIHIDIDPEEMGRSYPVSTPIVGDARLGLAALAEALEAEGVRRPSIGNALQAGKPAQRARLKEAYPLEIGIVDDMRTALGRDGILAADMTAMAYWCRRMWTSYRPNSFLFSMGFGTLGFGLPEAIGAKIAQPDRPLICIAGDGGYLFTGQELSTAIQQKLAFPVVIFNDHSYGAIKHFQRKRYGREFNADLVNPDFMLLAQAYGAQGIRLESNAQLLPALRKALESDRMTIIEAPAGDLRHPDGVPLPRY